MRVLVTGHHGYIGSVMVPTLLSAGHDVVGLDTELYGDCPFGEPSERDVPSIRADIRDVSIDDLTEYDAVVHLAALSNDPLGDLDAELTYDINQHATVRLARLARSAGVNRFLFSSSCSNYGASDDGVLTEEAAFNPVTPYGESKVRAEAGLLELASDEFSPVLLRSATAYGVSSRLRCDVVLNNLTAWAVATGKVMLKSDGTPWRPIVHIEDICLAFLAALEAPRDAVHAQAFNVVRPGENYRISELAAIVEETVPGCVIEFAGSSGPDARNYRVDASRITAALPAFQPKWTARDGARELYEAFCEHPVTLEDIEGWRYRRIGQINRLLETRQLTPDLRWKP
jgi:nucleoside-diphosphate-sugar epimerase